MILCAGWVSTPGQGERIPGGLPYVRNCKRIENVSFTWKNHSSFTLENRRPLKPYFVYMELYHISFEMI